MDKTLIAPDLWLGAKPTTVDDYEELSTFHTIIEFNNAHELSNKHVKHLDASRSLENRLALLTWHQFPLDDEAPRGAVDVYKIATPKFNYARYNKDKIYVHCKNGLHRSAHFLIFSQMLGGLTYEQSFEIIHALRPIEEKPMLKQQLIEWWSK